MVNVNRAYIELYQLGGATARRMRVVGTCRDTCLRFIDRGDLIVVLSGTELEARVVAIEAAGAHRDDFVGHEHVRLAGAIDAAAGARHDFDDVIFLGAGADVLTDFLDVGKAENLAEIELDAGDFDFGFADAFGATEGFEIEVFGLLAGEFFCGKADDSFGHTTGGAVDNASTGFEAEFFTEANADGGRNLGHDVFVRIVDGGHDFVVIAVADDSTGRADGHALALCNSFCACYWLRQYARRFGLCAKRIRPPIPGYFIRRAFLHQEVTYANTIWIYPRQHTRTAR